MIEKILESPLSLYLVISLVSLLVLVVVRQVAGWLPGRLYASWEDEAKEILEASAAKISAQQAAHVKEGVCCKATCSFGRHSRWIKASILYALGAGLVSVAMVKGGLTGYGAMLCIWLTALLTLTVIDFEHHILPDVIVLPLLWVGLMTNALFGAVSLNDAVWGVVGGYMILWLPASLFRLVRGFDGMGYGDFKLLAMIGAWLGWQEIPLVLMTASIAALLGGLVLLALKSKVGSIRTEYFAFGPFLAIGAIVALWT